MYSIYKQKDSIKDVCKRVTIGNVKFYIKDNILFLIDIPEPDNNNNINVIIPKEVEIIDEGVFYFIPITSIELHSGIKKIGKDAFWGCKLKKVSIPSGVKIIEEKSFGANTELIEVFLTRNIEEIQNGAFARCHSLVCINYNSSGRDFLNLKKHFHWNEGSFNICVKGTDRELHYEYSDSFPCKIKIPNPIPYHKEKNSAINFKQNFGVIIDPLKKSVERINSYPIVDNVREILKIDDFYIDHITVGSDDNIKDFVLCSLAYSNEPLYPSAYYYRDDPLWKGPIVIYGYNERENRARPMTLEEVDFLASHVTRTNFGDKIYLALGTVKLKLDDRFFNDPSSIVLLNGSRTN